MIKLIEKQKIIITYFQKGKSQRQIAREMDLNRRTVAKYVKGYETKKTQLADSKENTNQEELIADIVEDPRYDTARITEARVDSYSCIMVDGNHYSVPDHLVGKFVFIKIYPDLIICYHTSQKIASHKRRYGRKKWSISRTGHHPFGGDQPYRGEH